MKAALVYTGARIGLFAVLFFALSLVPVFNVYVAAGIAAVLALLISYIFFGRLRAGVAENLAKRREAPARDDDADAEDAELERKPVRRVAPSEDD